MSEKKHETLSESFNVALNQPPYRELPWRSPEELEAVLKAADRALGAMSQELADGRREKDYQNYLESLQKKEQTQQPQQP